MNIETKGSKNSSQAEMGSREDPSPLDHLMHLNPDSEESRRFLQALAQSTGDVRFTIQVFPDSDASKHAGNNARILHGSFDELSRVLTDYNRRGMGVFVCVNATDLKGRKAENVVSIRANFIDKDNGPINSFALKPSIVVESKNGDHAYFNRKDNLPLTHFKEDQKILISHYDSDTSIHDLPRVLRLPGYFHLKDPHSPFMVKIKEINEVRYNREEIVAAHASISTNARSEDAKTGHKRLKKFKAWSNSLATEEGAANEHGGRNKTALILCREGLGQGIKPVHLEQFVQEYCERSGLPSEEGRQILQRQIAEHKQTPFSSFAQGKAKSINAADMAIRLLKNQGLLIGDELRIRYWRGDFYVYEEGVYSCRPKSDIRARTIRWMQDQPDARSKSNPKNANDIIANIEAIALIPSSIEAPVFAEPNDSFKTARDYIVLRDCILEIKRGEKDRRTVLHPHSPSLFSLAGLSYKYDPIAQSPIWLGFLTSSLPDPKVRDLVQEMFGLALINDTSFQKFFIFYGEGANGKSVLLLVLRLLVGEHNVSSVGLEGFDAKRTFCLAATIGKLVNIVEELSETDKASEGLLKQYVSGGTITIEKKHRDPFDLSPGARLFFAANNLPNFNDRSRGMMRRVIVVPCLHSVLDESKQDRRRSDKNFWLNSGELPGVFNWALEGLFRLLDRGHFVEPELCSEARKSYEIETNPARQFLLEHFEFSENGRFSKPALYFSYKHWCELNGYSKFLGSSALAKEVRRVFTGIQESENPVQQVSKKRQREWIGLKRTGTEMPGETL